MKNILLILFLILFFGSRYIYYNRSIYKEYFDINIFENNKDINKDKCYSNCKKEFDKCKLSNSDVNVCTSNYNNCFSNKCGFYPRKQIYTGDYRGSVLVGNNFKLNKCCE